MAFVLRYNEQGCLECSIGESVIAIHDPADAITSMEEALDSVETANVGECSWCQPTGVYRWVFRRSGDKANAALIWSNGVVTGWEHVWWGEVDWAIFAREARAQLAVVGQAT